jgi:hypothetical protein
LRIRNLRKDKLRPQALRESMAALRVWLAKKDIQREVTLISFIGKSVAELYVPVPVKEKVLAVVQEAGCLIKKLDPMEQDPKGNTAENNREVRLAHLCVKKTLCQTDREDIGRLPSRNQSNCH